MRVHYYMDENENPSNIGVAKALTEVHDTSDLREIVGYLVVFIKTHQPTEGGAE